MSVNPNPDDAAADVLDTRQIMRLLPHRPPMLLIDRLIKVRGMESGTGIKAVSMSDPVFAGHFPGWPVMPGVLIIEAMAQTAGALVMNALGQNADGKIVYFMTVDKGRFRRPVGPGDVLEIPVKLMRSRGQVFRFSGEAFVDGKLCAEAEYSAMIVDGGAKESATGN
ncbi:MAG TPA: 3-hydroxyacyl-[acyl-carrier-protein] dehydratase FabZ [Alphaproteobacteria bacterium]|nr:3-hydroxyacyl-[acyl-carrier-protein] dehydratase FabZ [Alphaproteobacteria bacterium]HAJ46598.1 3-hydroxyacyl-[acyl-carrier-protein] dehydratase FabZ [Alphaproteobacteria bacterium]